MSTVDVQSEVNLPVEEDSNKMTNKKRKKSRKNSPEKDTTVTVAKGKKQNEAVTDDKSDKNKASLSTLLQSYKKPEEKSSLKKIKRK